jgi:ribonuclease P protein component
MVSSSACVPRMVRRFSRVAAARDASVSQSDDLPAVNAPAEALPKEKRVAKRRDFLRTYETGRKLFSRYAVVFFASGDLEHSRLGITATKKLGKANVRNRLKRWTREVYRRVRGPLDLDARRVDIIVNVKPGAAEATFAEYRDDLERVLRRLAKEAV